MDLKEETQQATTLEERKKGPEASSGVSNERAFQAHKAYKAKAGTLNRLVTGDGLSFQRQARGTDYCSSTTGS